MAMIHFLEPPPEGAWPSVGAVADMRRSPEFHAALPPDAKAWGHGAIIRVQAPTEIAISRVKALRFFCGPPSGPAQRPARAVRPLRAGAGLVCSLPPPASAPAGAPARADRGPEASSGRANADCADWSDTAEPPNFSPTSFKAAESRGRLSSMARRVSRVAAAKSTCARRPSRAIFTLMEPIEAG